jgi:hypothetical protein
MSSSSFPDGISVSRPDGEVHFATLDDFLADYQRRQREFNRLVRQQNPDLPKVICCLCDKVIKDDPYGHNASPVADGQCCGSCNASKVIPARMNANKSNKRSRK